MNRRKYHLIFLTVVSGLLLASCNHGGGTSTTSVSPNGQDSSGNKVSILISDIPFPGGILDTLNSIHAQYTAELANPSSNVNLYSESNTQAVNLGVYGADLAYVISFEQFQDVGQYLKDTKQLADDIGIPIDFTEGMIVRSENNKNNKDSLKNIVLQGYKVIDQTLKKNQRTASEALVLIGGWVEGTYLTMQSISTVKDSVNKVKLLQVLYRQKIYSDKLLQLLKQVSSSPYCNQLIPSVQDLRDAFAQLQIGGAGQEKAFFAIAEKVKDLRSLIIKGNS